VKPGLPLCTSHSRGKNELPFLNWNGNDARLEAKKKTASAGIVTRCIAFRAKEDEPALRERTLVPVD
jgi:hypothetical protein